MSAVKYLVNGEKTRAIAVGDRGLQYGHGVFETIMWRNSTLELWSDHMQRLLDGCERLFIPAPDTDELKKEVLSLCSETASAVIKIIITCGESERGYLTPENPHPNRVVSCKSVDKTDNYSELLSISVKLCETRYADQPQLAGIKHLNRLEQILAREEWRNSSRTNESSPEITYQEGLMRDNHNNIISATMGNIFFAKHDTLYTPGLRQCGIEGVMKKHISQIVKDHGYSLQSDCYGIEALLEADEIFITNSLSGIKSVSAVDETQFTAPGPITQTLWNQLQQNKL